MPATAQKPVKTAFDVVFHRKNWRDRYVQFRSNHPLECPQDTRWLDEIAIEKLIYQILQSTGILSGFPVACPWDLHGGEKQRNMPRGEMLYFMFLDLVLMVLAIDLAKDEDCHPNQLLKQPTKLLALVAHCVCDGRMLGAQNWLQHMLGMPAVFGRHGSFERNTTRLLTQNAGMGAFLGEFCNSFLLLDVCHIRYWCQQVHRAKKPVSMVRSVLLKQQHTWRRTLLMLMVAAAHANHDTSLYEARIIQHFIASSRLPNAYGTEAKYLLHVGISLDKIAPLQHDTPWLVRQFFLHTTLMTLIDNAVFQPQEHVFTQHLRDYLGVTGDDLQASLTTIAAFFHTHHQRFATLNGKRAMNNLIVGLHQRAQRLVKLNLKRIMREIEETRELKTLLLAATKRDLTGEEKQKVRNQLIDILKTIPSLAIFALPGGGLLLPILFRILPFDMLPSTFNEVMDES